MATSSKKSFYLLLLNTLISTVTNNFVWFAVIFWGYLETESVLTTAFAGGIFLAVNALSSFWFGSIVDHNKKRTAMLISSIATLVMFSLGFIFYSLAPADAFKAVASVHLWILLLILLLGVVAGGIRYIALPTLVTILIPENERDKANGLLGTVTGIAFSITSVASGLVVAFGGMRAVLLVAIVFTILAVLHLLTVKVEEPDIVHAEGEKPNRLDIKGTIKAIKIVPGLFALVFFTMFNNFLGGVFMALMDAYGLELVSVQAWGMLWGVLSMGFIVGGLLIAKRGLGKNPLRTLFTVNVIMWTVSIFFTIQPSIVLLAIGAFIWICLMPFAEASEQTLIQKIVPLERQGRVFGFAHSVEQAASPLSAFVIGPIAQLIFIPFMTTGAGVELIGSWFGVGPGRGMALVFILAGIIGLIVTLIAIRSRFYRQLSTSYLGKDNK